VDNTTKEEQPNTKKAFGILVKRGHTVDVQDLLVNVQKMSIKLCNIYSNNGEAW
jgi:hypothetical protein